MDVGSFYALSCTPPAEGLCSLYSALSRVPRSSCQQTLLLAGLGYSSTQGVAAIAYGRQARESWKQTKGYIVPKVRRGIHGRGPREHTPQS